MSDHKAEAERLIDSDDVHGSLNGRRDSSTILAAAQVHATLALAEQQRIANLIALAESKWQVGTESIFTDKETVLRIRVLAHEGLGL